MGRLFMPAEVEHRRQVVVLGQNPWDSLFPNIDPIGKNVRIGANEFTVIGVLGKRPSPGGFSTGADDFAVIPFTHPREVLRQGAQGLGEDFREQLQPGGVPHGDDRRRAATKACATTRCARSRR